MKTRSHLRVRDRRAVAYVSSVRASSIALLSGLRSVTASGSASQIRPPATTSGSNYRRVVLQTCRRNAGLTRFLVLALVATGLVVGCGGRVVGSESPLVMYEGFEGGGYPLAGSGPSGTGIRFIERGRFGIGIILRNQTE